MGNHPHLYVGQQFEFRGERYVINKVNPKNYRITLLDSDGNRTSSNYNLNRNANITVVNGLVETPRPVITDVPYVPRLEITLGSLVKFKDGTASAARWPGVHVVCGSISADRWRIAKLGGDHGRYVKCDERSLEVVALEDVVG